MKFFFKFIDNFEANFELIIVNITCKSMEKGNQRIHFDRDTMQRAKGMLIAQEGQVDVAETLGRSQSVISRV